MRYKSYQSFKLTPIWILIITNFLLFIATIVSRELIFLLGLQPAGFLDRPWTIVTNLFIHGSFLPDPKKVLKGDRKYKRYLEIRSMEDAPWSTIENLIKASIELDPSKLG